jgi:ketosteroid isomerase-like protein
MTPLESENAMELTTESNRIISMEERALARWCRGDPSGFLEIAAPDVVYFDPFQRERVDGLPALTAYYESIRGKVSADRWELSRPLVQFAGEAAVLTFQLMSWGGQTLRWNCTEVYRRDGGEWRIIQTHWAFAASP